MGSTSRRPRSECGASIEEGGRRRSCCRELSALLQPLDRAIDKAWRGRYEASSRWAFHRMSVGVPKMNADRLRVAFLPPEEQRCGIPRRGGLWLALTLAASTALAENTPAAQKLIAVMPLDATHAKSKLDSDAQALLEDAFRDAATNSLGLGWTVLSAERTEQAVHTLAKKDPCISETCQVEGGPLTQAGPVCARDSGIRRRSVCRQHSGPRCLERECRGLCLIGGPDRQCPPAGLLWQGTSSV